MKNDFRKIIGIGALLLATAPTFAQTYPYQDTRLSAEQRAADLVGRLTLEEKAALMQNSSPAIPRLGIKAYDWWNEALHGVARAGLATVFPQTIGMAASFNDDLLYQVFTAVSDEARAKHARFLQNGELKRYQGLTMWTPNINIFRDPRWGRGQETYGEDPYLTGQMGMAVVRGLQGPEDAPYDKLHACAKHFAVHSGPEWNRHEFNAENISPRDLWETYLPAFQEVVQKAHVKEVMCAYNRYEGDPCCGSDKLLIQILRNEWGYKGIIVSDCWAIDDFWKEGRHGTHPSQQAASAAAVLSGTDLECGPNYASLPQAVKEGLIDEKQIDISVKRLMKARFELGEMDTDVCWNQLPYSVVDSKKHRELALQIGRESIVLLQNRSGILPLKANQKIALIGPNANDSVMQWGNYNGYPSHTVTLLEALQQRVPASQLIYIPGIDHTSRVAITSLFNQCHIDGQTGFRSTYWNNLQMKGEPAAVTQTTTPFRFAATGGTAFTAGVNLRDFSARYETQFTPDADREVSFCFQAHGTVRLYINGERVAERWSQQNNDKLYTLKAEKGKTYDIRIESIFNDADRAAALEFDMGYDAPVDLQQAVNQVKDADVVVFAGGISPMLEGEEMYVTIPGFKGGDRTDIEMPEIQRELIALLKQAGKRIVLVNYSGSAIGLVPESQYCEAIIQAWYPGEEGGNAVADVLFGTYNPSGRLPVTFYQNVSQLPDFEDYSMKGRTYRYFTQDPLFPFGHGLSYTTFVYGNATLSNPVLNDGESITLSIPITNTGTCDGTETVQLYISRTDDLEGPSHTLRGFQKVTIPKGTTQTVTFTITPETVAWFDTATNTVHPKTGEYIVRYGGTSDLKQLKATTLTFRQ